MDANKKRPCASDEAPGPSKTSKILMSSPDLEGVHAMTGNDFLKLLGYSTGSINFTVLTDSHQMSVCGKSMKFATASFCVRAAVALRKRA